MEKRLILYAEDDADDRFIFENSFSTYSNQIITKLFNDGIELINYIKNPVDGKPCLIVLDINMPLLDGKDTLRIIRNIPEYSKTPVVLFTTTSSPIDRYFASLYNAGFITKPMDESGMKQTTLELLSYCGQNVLI